MKNENFETCKQIGDELEKIVNNEAFKCPDCGGVIYEGNTEYDEAHDTMTCPHCGAEFSSDDATPYSLYEYFASELDVEYYSRGRGADDYVGVRIMVACGGPNIYVDTKRGRVELHWWPETADYFLDDDVVAAIDNLYREYWIF